MTRLDLLLVQRQLANSRTHAKKLVDAGRVAVSSGGSWQPAQKASQAVGEDWELKVEPLPEDRYVSRAGLKLAAILDQTGLDPQGWRALDVGCSTGGFSDCLLQRGAELVVGVDVGHDQLAQKLRDDPRMHLFEGVNARHLEASQLAPYGDAGFDAIVMDVSFISQALILPQLPALLKPGGCLLSLVKPQFEVGPEGIGKGGLVRDAALYPQVRDKITDLCRELGLEVREYIDSPIKGGDGNREFLLWATRGADL
ncbi:23S rRNA (cytidine1920-2'-O)/16S rRNA (cytidine1409-2'-O)-methyltransferase [Microbulbifer donghaiensis]|uniref:23S rRNA (Cytidine1920-2'-O)/16S rRNA (Cytidine1409-2'-O)-methyltransferase n=1 Tax=Microbulbifer donghaiensis TaxID=494016 RepID=A0A1M5G2V0_9GAMM|nr:TlyA family RNA methyltransferase [Microbulbifer donghaiensis]SHF98039.1 23S rRNA (cytidine1920-2'-O)/16S rRNA (cytidine1409-2'-O)-methyltransferase [Microbulbifer donghaiensis]